MTNKLLIPLLLASALANAAWGTTPSTLSYQGVLRDSAGIVVQGDVPMRFHFWSDADKTSWLLTDDQGSVSVDRGLFNLELGAGAITPGVVADLPEAFRQSASVHVEVEVDGEVLSPLIALRAGAYALNADSLDGLDSTDFALADHEHSGEQITSGVVAEAVIDEALARDDEIVPAVLAADGPGSTLDADTLDGLDSGDILTRDQTLIVRRTDRQVATLRWYDVNRTFGSQPTGLQPVKLAFDGESLWVVLLGANAVEKRDVDDGSLLATVPVGFLPNDLAFDGLHVWVSDQFPGDVTKVRASDGVVLGSYPAGGRPMGLAFDGEHLWIADRSSDTALQMQVTDGAIVGVHAVGAGPEGVAFDGEHLWFAASLDGVVSKLRASDGALVDSYAVGAGPTAVAFDGRSVWIANTGSDSVTRLRAEDGAVQGTHPVGASPRALAFDGSSIWVACHGSGELHQLDARDGALRGVHVMPAGPSGLAFDGMNMWVASETADSVTRF